jgi:hypothetical protein
MDVDGGYTVGTDENALLFGSVAVTMSSHPVFTVIANPTVTVINLISTVSN